jgi:hypothetical protein
MEDNVVGTVEPKNSSCELHTFSCAAEILVGGQHCDARRMAERDGMGKLENWPLDAGAIRMMTKDTPY